MLMLQTLFLPLIHLKLVMYNHFEVRFGSFFIKLNIHLPYDTEILFLGIFPRKKIQ